MVTVPAPIESVRIIVAESFPPQYFLLVKSGLPNGCIRFDGYEVVREGDTIRVTVTNLEPADRNTVCTEMYGTVDSNIPLGSDFEPGKTYTVLVNDVTEVFVAQGPAPVSGEIPATLDSPAQLKVGQMALVAPQGPRTEFIEVVEDSRCAVGATCFWAGRARILVRVSSDGDVLGFGIQELTLEAGQVDMASNSVVGVYDTYLFQLVALDPYPQMSDRGAQEGQPDYTATLVVSKLPRRP
jgi:hypothetical protein